MLVRPLSFLGLSRSTSSPGPQLMAAAETAIDDEIVDPWAFLV